MGAGTSDTVVLIMREDKVRKVASSTLQKAGFKVLHTSQANSLEEFGDHAKDISLAIVDTDSSRQEVSELLRNIHRILPESRVLLISESAAVASLACHSHPGCWFMSKPFRRAQFLGQVLHVIAEPAVLTA